MGCQGFLEAKHRVSAEREKEGGVALLIEHCWPHAVHGTITVRKGR